MLTNAIEDLSGNSLSNFTSQFTAAADTNYSTYVVTQRPGPGTTVAPDTPVTLFTSAPMDAATLQAATNVTGNGVVMAGTMNVLGDGQSLQFTPSMPFQLGALAQLSVDASALNVYGTAITPYSSYWYIQPDLTNAAPQPVSVWPSNGQQSVPRNTIVDIEFNVPLDASTISPSTVQLRDLNSNPVSATITLRAANIIRIIPSSALAANSTYYPAVLSGITSSNGVAIPTSYGWYFTTGAASDTSPLTVTGVAPFNGSTGIGINALIRFSFNKMINPATVNENTLQISSGSTPITSNVTFDGTNMAVTLTPATPLPPNAQIALTVNGVEDLSANAATFSSSFTTANGPDLVAPTVVYRNVEDGATSVPLNTSFTVQFSEPMDVRTINASTLYLYDYTLARNVTANLSTSADGITAYLTPTAALSVGRMYGLVSLGALDLAGNGEGDNTIRFTTTFGTNVSVPQVVSTNPADGQTQVPTNTNVRILFSEPVQATSLSQVQLRAAGVPITITRAMSNGDLILTLVPSALLQPNTLYTVAITGIKDTAGNSLVGTVTRTFTTAGTVDLVPPDVVATDPASNTYGVGINVAPRVYFSKKVDPTTITVSYFYLYNNNTGQRVNATVATASDLMSASLTPLEALQPGTTFTLYISNYTDIAGNAGWWRSYTFTTSTAVDVSAPTVIQVSPPNGSTGVAPNPKVTLVFSQYVNPGSVTTSNIRLLQGTTAVPTSVALSSSDGLTVTLTPAALLSPSTTYTVQASGVTDVVGNLMVPFTSTFTTGTATVSDTTPATPTSSNPTNGATGVPVTSTVSITYNKAINPATVNTSTFLVYQGNYPPWAGGIQLSGTYSVSGGTITFTPVSPLAGGVVFGAYVYGVQDLAGNTANTAQISFTTANVADTTPPTVVMVSPANGASNVGRNTQVSITFSKSINPGSINPGTYYSAAVFNGNNLLTNAVSMSTDNRTMYFNAGALPANAVITVILTNDLQDLSGNHLADFWSRFTTAADELVTTPYVIAQRPVLGATGIPADAPVILFTSAPMDATTVPGALHLAENGQLVAATASTVGNGQTVEYVPNLPFAPSALAQVFFDSTAWDIYGNSLSAYSGYWYVQSDLSQAAPVPVSVSPLGYQSSVPRNAVVDIQFNIALDGSTVNGTNVQLRDSQGNTVSSSVTLRNPNTIRIAPSSTLQPNSSYVTYVFTGLKGADGVAAQTVSSFYFATGSASDTTLPAVTGITPYNGATHIGINTAVRANFSKMLNPTTVTGTTIQVRNGSNVLPATLTLDTSSYQKVTIVPYAPLPPNTNITIAVSGVEDQVGHAVTSSSVAFTIGNAPDFAGPILVSSSLDGNANNVPLNASFEVVLNEPIDPTTVNTTNFTLQPAVSATVTLSSDGLSILLVPSSNLPANTAFRLWGGNFMDLAGNLFQGGACGACFFLNFTTGSTTDTVPPVISEITPRNGATGVPTNAVLRMIFNKPIQVTSLQDITLTAGGSPVTFTPVGSVSLVTLVPAVVLSPNTTYTITIAGVKDTAGNEMANPVTSTFTTGSGAELSRLTVSSVTPANGAANVPVNTSVQVGFSTPVDPASFNSGNFYLRVYNTGQTVSATVTFSADHQTVILTPSAPLAAATQYAMLVGNISDWAGNAINGSVQTLFTTQ